MNRNIKIHCVNNGKTYEVPICSNLMDIYKATGLKMEYGPISAIVNNKEKSLVYECYKDKLVKFLDLTHPSALRTYTRTVLMILCKVVSDIFPDGRIIIENPVSKGIYCRLIIGRTITEDDIATIRTEMQKVIDANIPIERIECTTEEAIKLFEERGLMSKVKLLKSIKSVTSAYHKLGDYVDFYYGSLLPTTGMVNLYAIDSYYDGLLVRVPDPKNPEKLPNIIRQDKMFKLFKEHHERQEIFNISTIGDFNMACELGFTSQLITVSEAIQEKKISLIADQIVERGNVKVILIAGPSSSGKTTFSKRLSVQLAVNGIIPIAISLDDYFVNREQTPKDEKGDYDFESLYALDLPFFNKQLQELIDGKEIEIPTYNFEKGEREFKGKKIKMNENNILVLEGIHGLNPELTSQIPEENKFRVYVSALTSILLDEHNYIPTTDNRLLRRIIRDTKYRGCPAQETIRRWPSVRAGEDKWIFPYQENADAMFNSALLFELAVIRNQAIPALINVPENTPEYADAFRLFRFLLNIRSIEGKNLPPTSLLREFLGGSSFNY
ncbi:MAG: nucleoside kinase [Bacteroidaceae bacterium]|nr:nucleoside kinase [Bacteroidaceae bacterium]